MLKALNLCFGFYEKISWHDWFPAESVLRGLPGAFRDQFGERCEGDPKRAKEIPRVPQAPC